MHKLKELLRLRYQANLSVRQISRSLSLSVGAVSKYLRRATSAGLGWPLPDDLTEAALLAILQRPRQSGVPTTMVEPDFTEMARELTRKGMTRQLLWEEYAALHPDQHYSYSRFTVLFRQWRGRQPTSMRQVHRAGEKLFVDYCGVTMPVVNPDTGEARFAQVFVAVLGASSYTFAEATWSQSCDVSSYLRNTVST